MFDFIEYKDVEILTRLRQSLAHENNGSWLIIAKAREYCVLRHIYGNYHITRQIWAEHFGSMESSVKVALGDN
jgi:hypothetical protein